MTRKTATRGIELIKEFEGCRLTAYKCPAGVWTIGFGHTGSVDGKAITSGMTITAAKATELLKKDLAKFEAAVNAYVTAPITQPGDIWQLGQHRLICGDSTDEETLKRLLDGKKADLIVTDPPYNVAYEGKTKDKLTIQNDNKAAREFYTFLYDSFEKQAAAIKEGGVVYVCFADMESINFLASFQAAGFYLSQILIWNKSAMCIGRSDYQWKHEPIMYGWKKGAAHYFTDSRMETTVIDDKPNINKMSKAELKAYIKELLKHEPASTVIDEDKPARSAEHPTMKSVKLIAYLIRNSSRKGEIVLDVFGGSGTTLIACEQLGRRCYMEELDPKYCDVIIKRWEALTGQKAVRIEPK